MRYRLDVVSPTVLDAVQFAGGWIYDRVMAGWDVNVLVSRDEDVRPLQILGAETLDLESVLESWEQRPHPQTVAVAADLFGQDDRVRRGVLGALEVVRTLDALEIPEGAYKVLERVSAKGAKKAATASKSTAKADDKPSVMD